MINSPGDDQSTSINLADDKTLEIKELFAISFLCGTVFVVGIAGLIFRAS